MTQESFPLLSVIGLVAVSAFFSASETSLFSLGRFQLRELRHKNPDRFRQIQHLLDRPAALVATVLLGNELTNVMISNILAGYYEELQLSPLAITVINLLTVLPIIMIFGEITPKIIAAKANLSIAPLLVRPLWWFYKISFPVRFLLETSVNFLTKPLKKKLVNEDKSFQEDDLLHLLEEGKKKGAIHSVEQEMIENLFDIDDDAVIELATPLSECFVVQVDESPKAVIDKLGTRFRSRIPVWSDSQDNIVGILYAKDLLNYINRDEQEMTVRNLMKEPLYIESHMKAEVLFRRFRQLKRHIAIVVDKEEKAKAVITMEDLLEQMFGELWREDR